MAHFTNRLEFYVITIATIASLGMVAQLVSAIIPSSPSNLSEHHATKPVDFDLPSFAVQTHTDGGTTLGSGPPELGNSPLDAIMDRTRTPFFHRWQNG